MGKICYEKLIPFGFQELNGIFLYEKEILEGDFVLKVWIGDNDSIKIKLIDTATEEEYTLHLVEEAGGEYVGKIRSEISEIMQKIEQSCTENEVIFGQKTADLRAFIGQKYGDFLEFLWSDSPDAAIWRRKDNQKWYGIVMKIKQSRLGLEGEKLVDIANFKLPPEKIESLIDHKFFFPAYHMNKKYWITVLLDSAVSFEMLKQIVDESYTLAGGKPKKSKK